MFYVTNGPEFYSTPESDPLFGQPMDVINASAQELAVVIDKFVRQCLSMICDANTLELFVESQKEIPHLDLHLFFKKPYLRDVSIVFHGKTVGKTTIETVKGPNGTVIHQPIETWIANL